MSEPVGADVESLCTKCGDVWHVVVAKVGDRIARVQCKQCGGQHRLKPLGSAVAGPPSRAKEPRARRAGERAAKRAEPRHEDVPSVAADMTRPVRTYRPAEAYTIAERILHPSFGEGVVETIPGPGKMQVFFLGGRRVLAQAKAESTLARPIMPTGERGKGPVGL